MKLYGGRYSAEALEELLSTIGSIAGVSRFLEKPRETVRNWFKTLEQDKIIQANDNSENNNSTVLVIGDTHLPATIPGYLDHCKRIYDKYNCNYVVHMGDFADQYYLSYHEKDINLIECDREYDATCKMMSKWFEAFPEGTWILGNHDDLPNRKRKSLFLPKFIIKQLEEIYNVPDSWDIKNKVIIDNTLYIHTLKGGGGFPYLLLPRRLGLSLVMGHRHTQCGVAYFRNDYKTVFGMQVGCGINEQDICFEGRFDYAEDYVARPIINCGVVEKGQKAYLEPLIG